MSTTSMQTRDTEEERKGNAFAQMDAFDENQIIAETKGQILEEYFYEIKDKETGNVQVGLSFSGTKWAKRKMSEASPPHPLSVIHADVIDLPDSIRVMAIVEDLADHTKLIGAYEQPRMMKVAERDADGKKIYGKYKEVPNTNAFTLAVSKAERNGIRHHLPEKYILALFEEWKALKGGAKPSLPPAAPKTKDVTGEAKVSTPKRAVTFGEVVGVLIGTGAEAVPGEGDVVATVTVDTEADEGEVYAAVRDALKPLKPRVSMDGTKVTYSIKAEVA